jgi:hypothetical protein
MKKEEGAATIKEEGKRLKHLPMLSSNVVVNTNYMQLGITGFVPVKIHRS